MQWRARTFSHSFAVVVAIGCGLVMLSPPASAALVQGTYPPQLETDGTTNAFGVQVLVRGNDVLTEPTTYGQPMCVDPCGQGQSQEASTASVSIRSRHDVYGQPIGVRAAALRVNATWHYCSRQEVDVEYCGWKRRASSAEPWPDLWSLTRRSARWCPQRRSAAAAG
jgi:hypothetical protein